MALPNINREAVAKVLNLTPHVNTLSAVAGAVEAHPDLQAAIDTMNETGFISPFDWNAEFGDRLDDLADDQVLRSADLETLRKIFTAHVRLNRFRQGYLDEMVKQGKWSAMLARLQWLYDNNEV
jgi:hypothetical protein